jgi:hypothetical protein
MKCDEYTLKIQALTDNELEEGQIRDVLDHIQTCDVCRSSYIAMLSLNHKVNKARIPLPKQEWFEELATRKWKKGVFSAANLILLLSNTGLLAFLIVSFFLAPQVSLVIKVLIACGLGSVSLFLGLSFHEKYKESQNDRYREIMK